jgi:DNA primase
MPVKFDNNIILRIQQANDIVDVISEHVSLKKNGRDMVAICCFHDDHKPSMNVSPVKQIFKCFACGAGGDVFKFVQMRENLTFPQAVERLAERANIKLEKTTFTPKLSNTQDSEADPNMLARVNEWAAKLFQKNLQDSDLGKSARDYLTERQISQQSVTAWRVGLAVPCDQLIKEAKTRNISPKLLAQAGLVIPLREGPTDKFVNRLMFPITDVTKRVIGFGGRTLDGHAAKYLNSPTTILFDKSNSLYGLEQARHEIVKTSTAIVVEGYTDCIMPHQFEINNVVATLGTSLTSGHGRMLRRYAKKVILLYDNDVAGVEAANKALEICLQSHLDIKIASIPQGKDPCDYVLKAGKEKFLQMLEQAVDVFQFKWDRLLDNFSKDNTLRDKKTAVEEFLQTVAVAIQAGNLSAIDRGLIVNRLSSVIGLSSSQINAELGKLISRTTRTSQVVENQKVQSFVPATSILAIAQQEILEVLLNEPKFFVDVKQAVNPDSFQAGPLRQAAQIIFSVLATDAKAALTTILASIEQVEVANFLVGLAQNGQEKGNFQPRLSGALAAIKRGTEQVKIIPATNDEDQRLFLKKVSNNISKQNPHSIGMN